MTSINFFRCPFNCTTMFLYLAATKNSQQNIFSLFLLTISFIFGQCYFFFTFFLILEPSIFAFLLSLSDNGWLWEVTGQVWTCTTTSTYFIDFTVFPFFVCVLEKGELDGLSNIINLCSSLFFKYTLWVELKKYFFQGFLSISTNYYIICKSEFDSKNVILCVIK